MLRYSDDKLDQFCLPKRQQGGVNAHPHLPNSLPRFVDDVLQGVDVHPRDQNSYPRHPDDDFTGVNDRLDDKFDQISHSICVTDDGTRQTCHGTPPNLSTLRRDFRVNWSLVKQKRPFQVILETVFLIINH